MLVSWHTILGAQVKRTAYSVQEMNQEFSSPGPGSSDTSNYPPWTSSDTQVLTPPSYSPTDSASSSSSSSSSTSSNLFGGGYPPWSNLPPPMTGGNFPTGSSGFPGEFNGFPNSFSHSFSGGFGGGYPGGPPKPPPGPHGGFNSGSNGFSAVQGEIIDEDNPPHSYDYKPPHGKDINDLPHILPPGGKSIEQLQEEADFRLKKLFFEAKENQKSVQEKIKKLKENYGYGTFGFDGYKSPIKYGPINLGTHNAIDLGTSIDFNGLKSRRHGKLKLPVQTVTVTKTLGIHVPQPYPVKQEVPVPAPYPVIHQVPAPHHHHDHPQHHNYHPNHEIVEHYSGSYPSEFSEGGKSSYPGPPSSISKLVRYHESIPKSSVKSFPLSYKSSSPSYSSYQPPNKYTTAGHSSHPNDFLMPPSPGSRSYGYDSHHYSS